MSGAIEVGLYGRLAGPAGRRLTMPAPDSGCTVAELRAELALRHPALAIDIAAERSRALVDDTVADDSARVAAGQRVDFLPPVSGG